MDKQVDLAQDPALTPEERERQLKGETSDQDSDFKYRRSTYLIDKDFQYRFATTWIASVLLYVGLICLSFYWAASVVETSANNQLISAILSDVSTYVGVFAVLLTILFGMYFLLLSHRISGPAYRLTESLKRIAGGDIYFTVQLRESDYLKSISGALNTLLESLRSREQSLEELEGQVHALRETIEERDDLEEDREELAEQCEAIHKQLRSIRTTTDPEPNSDASDEE